MRSSKLKTTFPIQNSCDKRISSWKYTICHTALDHSQKAEKVCQHFLDLLGYKLTYEFLSLAFCAVAAATVCLDGRPLESAGHGGNLSTVPEKRVPARTLPTVPNLLTLSPLQEQAFGSLPSASQVSLSKTWESGSSHAAYA